MRPDQLLPIRVRVDLGIILMKGYSKLFGYPEVEPHHQMLFSVISRTSIGREGLTLCRRYCQDLLTVSYPGHPLAGRVLLSAGDTVKTCWQCHIQDIHWQGGSYISAGDTVKTCWQCHIQDIHWQGLTLCRRYCQDLLTVSYPGHPLAGRVLLSAGDTVKTCWQCHIQDIHWQGGSYSLQEILSRPADSVISRTSIGREGLTLCRRYCQDLLTVSYPGHPLAERVLPFAGDTISVF